MTAFFGIIRLGSVILWNVLGHPPKSELSAVSCDNKGDELTVDGSRFMN